MMEQLDVYTVMSIVVKDLTKEAALKLSLVCKSSLAAVKSTVDRLCTFRIPFEMKMEVFSPQSVIIYSPHSIPSSATCVVGIAFNANHCQELINSLPSNLVELKLEHFNEPCYKLPGNLTHLVTADEFNYPVHKLPPKLTHFITGESFNQSVHALPSSLTHFASGNSFNQPISSRTITHLTFGDSFNQMMHNLPLSITHLSVRRFRFQSLFSRALTHLTICYYYEGEYLPSSLTHLTIRGGYSIDLEKMHTAPSALTHLTVTNTHKLFPHVTGLPKLTHLTYWYNHSPIAAPELPPYINFLQTKETPIENTAILEYGNITWINLPQALKRLTLPPHFNRPIDYTPPTLTHLTTGDRFNRPVNQLPPTLTNLITGNNFNQPLLELPTTLTHLTTGWNYIHSAPNFICLTPLKSKGLKKKQYISEWYMKITSSNKPHAEPLSPEQTPLSSNLAKAAPSEKLAPRIPRNSASTPLDSSAKQPPKPSQPGALAKSTTLYKSSQNAATKPTPKQWRM